VIKLLSDEGDLVLDPFSGSGTSLVAAIELDRIALGFELSPKYARLSERNLSAAIIDREARLPL
jgi:DNA modification methylase